MKAAANQAAKANGASQVVPKRGRPTLYTEDIADEICERLAQGESLRSICRDWHLPSAAQVVYWSQKDDSNRPGFSERYARARELGCYSLAEELLEISDAECMLRDQSAVDSGAVQRARLMSDNRKWLLSKMLPKTFGDKVTQEVTGADGAALLTAQNDPSKVALVLLGILQRSREKATIEVQQLVEDGREDGSDDKG